jgi:hypothetical protein
MAIVDRVDGVDFVDDMDLAGANNRLQVTGHRLQGRAKP